jgi:hypothetical protein
MEIIERRTAMRRNTKTRKIIMTRCAKTKRIVRIIKRGDPGKTR